MKDEFDSLKKNKVWEQLEIEESSFIRRIGGEILSFFACGPMI